MLVLVLRDEQRLLVIGKLHFGAQHIDAGCGAGVVLVLGELQERGGVGDARLSDGSASGGGLGIEVETGNDADDEVARVLEVEFAGIDAEFAGLEVALAFEIDNVLLRIDAEVVIGEGARRGLECPAPRARRRADCGSAALA